MADNVQQGKKYFLRRARTQHFLPIGIGTFLLFIGIIFPYLGGSLYGAYTPLGLAYVAIGLAIEALAIGVIYHAVSRNTLSDRIDRLQRRIDLLLLDPKSPVLSGIDSNKQELGHLQEDVLKLEKQIGQSGRSLTSEINAKISQVKELLEL